MKNLVAILFLAVLAIVPFTPQLVYSDEAPKKELEHTKDTLEEVKKRVEEKKAILVDVRELAEWNNGHIVGAVNLPWREMHERPDEKKIREKLDKDKIIYTYCEVGFRSLRAGKVLEKYGFEVRPLKPGYKDLVSAGFKSEK